MKRHRILKLSTIMAIMMLLFAGVSEPVFAKTTPSFLSVTKIHTKKAAKKYKTKIAKSYNLSYGYQTGFTKTNRIAIYDATHSTAMNLSLNRAISDWNAKLGREVFYQGTAKKHTITLKFTTPPSTATPSGVAWWVSKSRHINVSKPYFNGELLDITKLMKRNYLNSSYQELPIDQANTMIDTELAGSARIVEFSRILDHEMGHALGMKHSKNSHNLMYKGVGYGDIYQFDDVYHGRLNVNLITKNDLARAKAGIKMYDLLH